MLMPGQLKSGMFLSSRSQPSLHPLTMATDKRERSSNPYIITTLNAPGRNVLPFAVLVATGLFHSSSTYLD